jgi:hypothetical protein
MAKHTITVIHRTMGGNSRVESKIKNTSAQKKTSTSKIANKVKPSAIVEKPETNNMLKFSKGLIAYKAITKSIQQGVNIYATIYEASSGEYMRTSNIRAKANALLNPISYLQTVAVQSFLETKRVSRFNQSLEYQRQLTGELAFSKSLNNGTF